MHKSKSLSQSPRAGQTHEHKSSLGLETKRQSVVSLAFGLSWSRDKACKQRVCGGSRSQPLPSLPSLRGKSGRNNQGPGEDRSLWRQSSGNMSSRRSLAHKTQSLGSVHPQILPVGWSASRSRGFQPFLWTGEARGPLEDREGSAKAKLGPRPEDSCPATSGFGRRGGSRLEDERRRSSARRRWNSRGWRFA